MKRRARRSVIGVAALVAVLVAVLIGANWSIVRDHVEAWWFAGTRDTQTVFPGGDEGELTSEERVYQQLADRIDCPVIFDPGRPPYWGWHIPPGGDRQGRLAIGELTVKAMRDQGWRILEQHFPHRALVVVQARPFSSKEEALEYVRMKAREEESRAPP